MRVKAAEARAALLRTTLIPLSRQTLEVSRIGGDNTFEVTVKEPTPGAVGSRLALDDVLAPLRLTGREALRILCASEAWFSEAAQRSVVVAPTAGAYSSKPSLAPSLTSPYASIANRRKAGGVRATSMTT